MKRELLEGAWLKLKRAEQHVDELDVLLEAFRQTEPYFVWREHNAKTGETIIKTRIVGKVPDVISLVFGDVIHNLRAALDFTWRAFVASRRTIDPLEEIRFPFAWNEEAFNGPKFQAPIRALGEDILRIIGHWKPYKGGNDVLFLVHRLDIEDKHKPLIAFAVGGTGTRLTGPITLQAERIALQSPLHWALTGEDIVLATFTNATAQTGPEAEGNLKPIVQVAIRDVGAQPEPIETLLGQMFSTTRHVIDQLSLLITGALG